MNEDEFFHREWTAQQIVFDHIRFRQIFNLKIGYTEGGGKE